MLLSAANTIDKQDVQPRTEDESQWVSSGVVWWSAVTAQQKGSEFDSTLSVMSLDMNGGNPEPFCHVYDSCNTLS